MLEKEPAHFHHFALELRDFGEMRLLLDHLAKHGRWVIWGPGRHGVAASIFAYIRIPEEELIVELYCDMEQLARRPRAARLGGHAALLERLGHAAAAHVLPLRRRRRSRSSAASSRRSAGRPS